MSKEFIRTFAEMRQPNDNLWFAAAMHVGFYMLVVAFLILMAQVGYAVYQLAVMFS
jgi:hypothetical protein